MVFVKVPITEAVPIDKASSLFLCLNLNMIIILAKKNKTPIIADIVKESVKASELTNRRTPRIRELIIDVAFKFFLDPLIIDAYT